MIYLLLFGHWIADFVAQTEDMSKNKSKSWYWLGRHIFTYSWVLSLFAIVAGASIPLKYTYIFVALNGGSHFFIDAVTSRLTSILWSKGSVRNFFAVIGFDQFLHISILIYSYNEFLKG